MRELCLGVCCPIHAQCTRYLDVEGAMNATFMGTCLEDGKRPLFIRVNTEQNNLQSEKTALRLRHQQTECIMTKTITAGNRAVVINDKNGRVTANLYVNIRLGLQDADITYSAG